VTGNHPDRRTKTTIAMNLLLGVDARVVIDRYPFRGVEITDIGSWPEAGRLEDTPRSHPRQSRFMRFDLPLLDEISRKPDDEFGGASS
jgi:hypothetical protein